MRKLLGYIPLDPGEDRVALSKETDVVYIDQQWFKLAEVWIQGIPPSYKEPKFTATPKGTQLFEPVEFAGFFGPYDKCKNCNRYRNEHLPFVSLYGSEIKHQVCPVGVIRGKGRPDQWIPSHFLPGLSNKKRCTNCRWLEVEHLGADRECPKNKYDFKVGVIL